MLFLALAGLKEAAAQAGAAPAATAMAGAAPAATALAGAAPAASALAGPKGAAAAQAGAAPAATAQAGAAPAATALAGPKGAVAQAGVAPTAATAQVGVSAEGCRPRSSWSDLIASLRGPGRFGHCGSSSAGQVGAGRLPPAPSLVARPKMGPRASGGHQRSGVDC